MNCVQKILLPKNDAEWTEDLIYSVISKAFDEILGDDIPLGEEEWQLLCVRDRAREGANKKKYMLYPVDDYEPMSKEPKFFQR